MCGIHTGVVGKGGENCMQRGSQSGEEEIACVPGPAHRDGAGPACWSTLDPGQQWRLDNRALQAVPGPRAGLLSLLS